jgi:signal transduction histidine kinase
MRRTKVGPNILLVDDDPLALHLMAGIVQIGLPSANIHHATEFSRASMLCELVAIDCMIIDYDMPDANGLVLARHLREKHPYLPIIMCTGNGDEMLAAQALRNGINDYLPKERISAASIQRSVTNAMSIAAQARTIDDQSRELETIAFALANNFRSPIAQIRKSVEEAIEDRSARELALLLERVSDAAGRLDRLVDLLLQFVTLNDFVEPAETEIAAVARQTVAALEPVLKSRNATISVEGEATAWADARLVGSALRELLFNGITHNLHGDPEIRVQIMEGETGVEIRVQDNGVGMSELERGQLFETFATLAEPDGIGKANAAGLGLALARKAIEAQQGTIACTASAERGSAFAIRLPIPQRVDLGVAING